MHPQAKAEEEPRTVDDHAKTVSSNDQIIGWIMAR